MEKVADKVSQLVKRNSKEKLTDPDTPLPAFKPIPKIQLHRSSSLPRIEVDRPATPSGTKGQNLPGKPVLVSGKLPQNDYSLGQIIPPNAKKLRVRSFLWVKPSSSSGLDTSIYYQVQFEHFSFNFTNLLLMNCTTAQTPLGVSGSTWFGAKQGGNLGIQEPLIKVNKL